MDRTGARSWPLGVQVSHHALPERGKGCMVQHLAAGRENDLHHIEERVLRTQAQFVCKVVMQV